MKKMQRFLAAFLTVILCAGSIGDAGFRVYAAEEENEAASEAVGEEIAEENAEADDELISESQEDDGELIEAADDPESSDLREETEVSDGSEAGEAEEAEEALDEESPEEAASADPDDTEAGESAYPDEASYDESDPIDEDIDADGAVSRLIVNGINMLTADHKDRKLTSSGGYASSANKDYMYYDSKTFTLTLNNIKLDGNSTTSIGIDFKGDRLYIEVVGECQIAMAGLDGEDAYGIYSEGNLTIKNTTNNGENVMGYLYIKGATNTKANWIAGLYCEGLLDLESPGAVYSGLTYYGLKLEIDASEITKTTSCGELVSKYDLTVDGANVNVYGSFCDNYSIAIDCGKKIQILSGEVNAYIDAWSEVADADGVAIKSYGDISIGKDAHVEAQGVMSPEGADGWGISIVSGKLNVAGSLCASGNDKALSVGSSSSPCIVTDGTYITVPEEGVVDDSKKTIVDGDGKVAANVGIYPGQYYDLWIGGERIGTQDLDSLPNIREGGSASFDPETGILEFKNVKGIDYIPGPSAKSKEIKDLVYSRIPLKIRGNAEIKNYTGSVISIYGDTEIQGDFKFTSEDKVALEVHNATLTIDGEDTVLYAKGGKYGIGREGSGIGKAGDYIQKAGKVETEGIAGYGIYCDGDIMINGGEFSAKGRNYAVVSYSQKEEYNVIPGKGIEITEPAGAVIGRPSDRRAYCTVLDGDGKPVESVKFSQKSYDLWIGSTRVTSSNFDDILGDGSVSFDPESSTLSFKDPGPIAGSHKIGESEDRALIYSEIPIHIVGSAAFNSEYSTIAIESGDATAISEISGDFSILAGKGGMITDGGLVINGADSFISAQTVTQCISASFLQINNARVELKSTGRNAISAGKALALNGCELTATGNGAAIKIFSAETNVINLSDDIAVIEPENGTVKVIDGATVIADAAGKQASYVQIGKPLIGLTVTAETVDREYKSGDKSVELKNVALSGVKEGDDVSLDLSGMQALMDDEDVGQNKAVTVTGIKLTGKDAAGYRLISLPQGLTVNISKAEWGDQEFYLVLGEDKIGTAQVWTLPAAYAAPAAFMAAVTINPAYDQLEEGTKIDSGMLYFTVKEGTAPDALYTVLYINVNGGPYYKDYLIALNIVGDHKHNKDTLKAVAEVSAKCLEDGVYAHYECSICHKLFKEDGDGFAEAEESALVIPALGHDWDEGEIVVYPTASTDGKMVYHCRRAGCGETKESVIPAETDIPGPSALNPVPENLGAVTKLTLVKGQKFTMPGSGWKSVESADKKYVSVSRKGVVKAKKVTEDGVVSRITDGNRTISIRVVAPGFTVKRTLDIEAGKEVNCGFNPGDPDLPVAYYSSAPDVAMVEDDGTVNGLTAGTVTITAYVNGKAYNRKVKVKESTPLTEREIHMTAGVKKNVKISGVKISEWTVSESDKDKFEIKKTYVTPKEPGEYELTGKDKSGSVYAVYVYVEDFELDPSVFTKKKTNVYNITLNVGQSADILFKHGYQNPVFKASKGAVAYADEDNTIHAQSVGKSTLKAKVNGKTITINVTVK